MTHRLGLLADAGWSAEEYAGSPMFCHPFGSAKLGVYDTGRSLVMVAIRGNVENSFKLHKSDDATRAQEVILEWIAASPAHERDLMDRLVAEGFHVKHMVDGVFVDLEG